MQTRTVIIIRDSEQLRAGWRTALSLCEKGENVCILLLSGNDALRASVLSATLNRADLQHVPCYSNCPDVSGMPEIRHATVDTMAGLVKTADFVMSF